MKSDGWIVVAPFFLWFGVVGAYGLAMMIYDCWHWKEL